MLDHGLQRDEKILHFVKNLSEKNNAWNLVGLQVEDAGQGWTLIRLPFDEKLLHPGMRVHGGFLAMLVDSAIAAALLPTLEENEDLVTIDLKMNYIRSVRNTDVLALAKLKHRGRTTSLIECTLYDAQSGKEVAYGIALYMILR